MKVDWVEFGNRFEIDDVTKAQLLKVYPFFERELLKMEIWYIANPKKRKKNHYRFIVSWLNRVNDREGLKPVGVKRDYRKEEEVFKQKMEEAIKEAAPPPDEWRRLLNKFKRGTA